MQSNIRGSINLSNIKIAKACSNLLGNFTGDDTDRVKKFLEDLPNLLKIECKYVSIEQQQRFVGRLGEQ